MTKTSTPREGRRSNRMNDEVVRASRRWSNQSATGDVPITSRNFFLSERLPPLYEIRENSGVYGARRRIATSFDGTLVRQKLKRHAIRRQPVAKKYVPGVLVACQNTTPEARYFHRPVVEKNRGAKRETESRWETHQTTTYPPARKSRPFKPDTLERVF